MEINRKKLGETFYNSYLACHPWMRLAMIGIFSILSKREFISIVAGVLDPQNLSN